MTHGVGCVDDGGGEQHGRGYHHHNNNHHNINTAYHHGEESCDGSDCGCFVSLTSPFGALLCLTNTKRRTRIALVNPLILIRKTYP